MEYIFMPVLQNVPDYFWYFFAVDLALSLTLTNAQSVHTNKPCFLSARNAGAWPWRRMLKTGQILHYKMLQ